MGGGRSHMARDWSPGELANTQATLLPTRYCTDTVEWQGGGTDKAPGVTLAGCRTPATEIMPSTKPLRVHLHPALRTVQPSWGVGGPCHAGKSRAQDTYLPWHRPGRQIPRQSPEDHSSACLRRKGGRGERKGQDKSGARIPQGAA